MAQKRAGADGPPGGGSDPRIDVALAMIEKLDEVAVDRHPATYARADDKLREALTPQPEPSGAPARPWSEPGPSP